MFDPDFHGWWEKTRDRIHVKRHPIPSKFLVLTDNRVCSWSTSPQKSKLQWKLNGKKVIRTTLKAVNSAPLDGNIQHVCSDFLVTIQIFISYKNANLYKIERKAVCSDFFSSLFTSGFSLKMLVTNGNVDEKFWTDRFQLNLCIFI